VIPGAIAGLIGAVLGVIVCRYRLRAQRVEVAFERVLSTAHKLLTRELELKLALIRATRLLEGLTGAIETSGFVSPEGDEVAEIRAEIVEFRKVVDS